MYVKHLRRRLKRAFSLQELRMDLAHTINDDEDIPDNHEWKRAADFLLKTGDHDWGHDSRCIRLDRFDLEDVHVGFESACDWERTKALVLNSLLRWHYRLFPDRDESKSVRGQYQDRRHALGMPIQDRQNTIAELVILQKLLVTTGSNIRVISINEYRFWIEPTTRKIWHLRDSLEGKVQSVLIKRSLDARDWEFLSERATIMPPRGGNTAAFLRTNNKPSADS
jgi:hypothetical protein